MPKIPVLNGKEVVKVLEKLGYTFSRQKGSHIIMFKNNVRSVPVPNHNPISTGTLAKILKQVGIDTEKLKDLLKK